MHYDMERSAYKLNNNDIDFHNKFGYYNYTVKNNVFYFKKIIFI